MSIILAFLHIHKVTDCAFDGDSDPSLPLWHHLYPDHTLPSCELLNHLLLCLLFLGITCLQPPAIQELVLSLVEFFTHYCSFLVMPSVDPDHTALFVCLFLLLNFSFLIPDMLLFGAHFSSFFTHASILIRLMRMSFRV